MFKFSSSNDINVSTITKYNKEKDGSICFNHYCDSTIVLDDDSWSLFMREGGAKFIMATNKKYYYNINDKLIIIPVAYTRDDNTYMNISNITVKDLWQPYQIDTCNVNIEDNFYGVFNEVIEAHGFKDSIDFLNRLNKKENILENIFIFAVTDAIEACIYNELRNIVGYHSDMYFDGKNTKDYDNDFVEHIEYMEERIDSMHSFDLDSTDATITYEHSHISFINMKLSKLAGTVQELSINSKVFYEKNEEGTSLLQSQMNKLLKKIIETSSYNIKENLYVK